MGLLTNLRAYYKFTDLTDSSGNGKTLTQAGTVNNVSSPFGNGKTATWNTVNCLYNSTVFPSVLGSGDITFSCWFKKASPPTNDFTPTIMELGQQYRVYLVASKTNGYASLYSYDAGGGTNVESNKNVCDGIWHHIVGVRSGTSLKVYVDAILVGSTTGTVRVGNGTGLWIGTAGDATYDNLTAADIDEVAVWSSALTADEVNTLYVGSLTYPFTKTSQLTKPRGHSRIPSAVSI